MYVACVYKIYVILFVIFGLIIIFSYLLNFNVIFELSLDFFKFINCNNFLLSLMVDYIIKLPVLFVYSKMYDLLNYFIKCKDVNNIVIIILDYIFIPFLYILLNMPVFLLNSVLEALIAHHNERTLFKRKNLLCIIYSVVNQHILINMLFYGFNVCSKKIILEDGMLRLD